MMKLKKTIVILDLETTGTWLDKDKIIEIAMIKLLPSGEREVFHKKVNPGMPIPKVVSDLTSISNEDVKCAPYFKEIAREVAEFIGSADLGGFNIDKFDLPILERELQEAGQSFYARAHSIYDAQKVFHLNERRDLTAAYQFYCSKKLEDAHSALADTEAALSVLEAQVAKYGEGDASIETLSRFNYVERQEFYDCDKKFRWWNGELYMMFGKYARKESLREIARKDPHYLEWILSKDFSDDVKSLVERALKGQFPQPGSPENP